MSTKTTEAGKAVGASARVAVRVAKAARVTGRFLRRSSLRKEKCQDVYIHANERQWHGDYMGSGGVGIGGDGTGAKGGEEKTRHYHNDKIRQHHHDNRSHHHMQSHGDEAAYQLVPPDGGWGWMVVLGTFIILTLLPMMGNCFSVLFSEYLLGAGSSSTTTSWIFNAQSFLCNISALLARPLTEEFGWRLVALTCSAMAAAGLMISAFTPSPSFLFFSFSFLTGFGGGVVTCQCFTILPHYFLRRRGFANGIMMSGMCVGQLIGPPITRFLQASYAFRGATLILGALTLNACVGAAFFHPFEWHQKKVPLKKDTKDIVMFPAKNEIVGQPDLTSCLVHSSSDASFPGGTAEGEIEGNLALRKRLSERLGGRRVKFPKRSSKSGRRWSLSSEDMESVALLPVEDNPELESHGEEEQNVILVRVVKSLIRDLGALKSLRVCILCLSDTMCLISFTNFLMMVPFAMLEMGFHLDASAWCLSLSAGCNMVARFLVSALTDWPRFNMRLAYISGFALIAFSIFAFTLVSSMDWLMVTMVVLGIGIGINMSIYNLVIIDVMGVERLGPVFGTACFVVAIGFIGVGPFIGVIRDLTQSYTVSMRITGGMSVVALTGWFFMGLAERVDRRREEGRTLSEALLNI